jgi:CHASE2 domain-containing sensor protein
MKPIPLHNPWHERRRKAGMALMLIVIAIAATRPSSLIGVAIALSTIPVICLALLSFNWWWHKIFAGSKLLSAIHFLFLMLMFFALKLAAKAASPYIGEYFA